MRPGTLLVDGGERRLNGLLATRALALAQLSNSVKEPDEQPVRIADARCGIFVINVTRAEDLDNFFGTIRPEWWEIQPTIQASTGLPISFEGLEAELALRQLAELQEDWDHEGGAAANLASIDQAVKFVRTFGGVGLDWEPSLHADGRAMLEAHTDVGRAYVLFGPSSRFVAFAAPHGTLPRAEEMDFADGPAMSELSERMKFLGGAA